MNRARFRRILGMLVLLASLATLIWGVWPVAAEARTLPVFPAGPEQPRAKPTAAAAPPTPQEELSAMALGQPSVPEQRLLIVEWPPEIRIGDAEIIRLSLVMDEAGRLTPTASVEGSQLQAEPLEIPNLYATHNVIAEARLDLAGVEHRPSGQISEALLPGKPVVFVWSVRPAEIGRYRGTLWLHLRFAPRQAGDESSMVLTAQLIEIEAVNFLGLGGPAARVLGSVGVVVGSLLGLDNLFSFLLRLLQMRKGAEG